MTIAPLLNSNSAMDNPSPEGVCVSREMVRASIPGPKSKGLAPLREFTMKTNGLVVLPGQELIWQMEPDRTATFKLLSEQTGNSVAIFEELIPTGFGTALHLHHTSDEAMCVLSGDFSFKIGDSISRGGAGTWAV